MVSLVLVSHSSKLARAVRDLARQMAGAELTIALASGVGARHQELGTDAVYIAKMLRKACGPDGTLVLMDLGSAVLSAEMALELLDPNLRARIRLCSGPLVEGTLAAAVQAAANSPLEDVFREAQQALSAKAAHFQEVAPLSAPRSATPSITDELVLVVENEHGLHARPAATLIRALSPYRADIQITNESSSRGPASARSMTSLALLQIGKGDCIRVKASGDDRAAALAKISELAAEGFGESTSLAQPLPAIAIRLGEQQAVPASDGIAVGPLVALRDLPIIIPETSAESPEIELDKLTVAMGRVRTAMGAGPATSQPATDVLEAQALILDDPVLLEKVRALVESKRWNAARAWMAASSELAELYQNMDDPYLRERAADVRDIARRVLRDLLGQQESAIRLQTPAILFTDELLASDAAACDPAMVVGVITRQGSPTAHSSILLRTREIPMLVGAGWLDEKAVEGKTVAFDGATGEIWVSPDPSTLAMLAGRRQARQSEQQAAGERQSLPSVTLDDVRIEVLANVANVNDAATAALHGAEGIGLLRSEFLFLGRAQAPTEAEQEEALREIFAAMPGTIIVRTLDVGADKPLAFLPGAQEKNPFLGVRGIRLALQHPEFFLTHLRAIVSAAARRDVWLMLPMIAAVDEIRQTRQLLETVHHQLEAQGHPHLWPVKLGIMIEVPAAALIAEQLAAESEFFSIGTNDLTQYVMAAERGTSALGTLQDTLQPAVLRLIKKVVNSAALTDRHVSVCGDAASDPLAAAVLAGLGVRSLSVRPKQVAEIKELFRHQKMSDLTGLGHDVLQCVDAAHVRTLARECIEHRQCSTL